MSTDEKNKRIENEANLMDHNYDGIQEYDNSLPSWWLATLWGTIIFGVLYSVYYLWGNGPSLVEEFKKDWTQTQVVQVSSGAGNSSGNSEEELLVIAKQENRVTQGEGVYKGKCASCHGFKGEGSIGPNLVDNYWIHGGKFSEIKAVIEKGVPEKGMPPWGSMLKEEEVGSLLAYMRKIHGTNPENAKTPQGNVQEDLSQWK